MKTPYKILLGLGLLFLAGKLVHWWWNPSELVSFQGKDVPVVEVLNSFSKQTGRTILYPELEEKVTLDINKVPLEDALQTVTEQAELSHTRVFILAADSKSEKTVLENARKQTEQPMLLRMGRGSRWMSGGQERQRGLVSYSAVNKQIDNVIAELNLGTDSYFYYAGDVKPVSVDWKEKPVRDAAAELASITDTDAERLYQVFKRESQRAERRRGEGGNFMQEWMDRTAEQIATLPPAEKAAAEEQLKAQQERFQEFANMTDEQRMQRVMERLTQGDPEQRLIRRLKNSTAESRAKRYKRWEARRQASGSGTPPPAPLPQKQANP